MDNEYDNVIEGLKFLDNFNMTTRYIDSISLAEGRYVKQDKNIDILNTKEYRVAIEQINKLANGDANSMIKYPFTDNIVENRDVYKEAKDKFIDINNLPIKDTSSEAAWKLYLLDKYDINEKR